MRMAFPTSMLYISSAVAVVLVAATTAVARTPTSSSPAVGVVASNATVSAANNGTVALSSSSVAGNSDEYICYLCFKRNTLMIKRCPLYKDGCHIACLSSPSSSPITSFLSSRALQPPGPDDGRRQDNAGDWPGAEDCYVMKLYPDGSWKIVSVVDCYAVAGCQLACSYYDDDATITASKDNGAAAIVTTRRPPPRVAEFERCGDQ